MSHHGEPLMASTTNMSRPIWQLFSALALSGICGLSGPSQAFAQAPLAERPQAPGQRPQQVLFDFEAILKRTLAPGLRAYSFQRQMKIAFDMHDSDRDGAITDADRQRNRQHFEAMQRAQYISLLLQADLNSDGIITRDELAIHARYASHLIRGEGAENDARRAAQERQIIESRMRADTNGDGKIDWQELFAYAKKYPMVSPTDFDAPYRALLSFDADGDGKTTFKEFTEAMERRFAELDADGDGIISRAEFDAYWQRSGLPTPKVAEIQATFQEKLAIECAVPKPAKDVKFVLLNGYRPVALSSVAIGSQNKETLTTKVIIEPGPEPLYLVMIAWDRTIWQFEGAVGRVKRVILAEGAVNEPAGTPVGATGLARELVTIANSDRCGTFWVNMNKRYPKETAEYARLLFGREPDMVVSSEDMWNLHLPSGRVSRPAESDREMTFPEAKSNPKLNGLRREFLQSFPGGVVSIDPAAVIAVQPVTKYEVLPGAARLMQLMNGAAQDRKPVNPQ